LTAEACEIKTFTAYPSQYNKTNDEITRPDHRALEIVAPYNRKVKMVGHTIVLRDVVGDGNNEIVGSFKVAQHLTCPRFH
jgi:hypothetical protein